jgi:hypothetical protein
MLDPRAVALQGIGYGPAAIALFGVAEVAASSDPPDLAWINANARAYGKRRTAGYGREYGDAEEMRRSIALLRQIEEEDEIVLALVMSAVPLLGADQWRQ